MQNQIISIVRSSLNAVTSALDLLEAQQTAQSTVQQEVASPVVEQVLEQAVENTEPVVKQVEQVDTVFQNVMNALNDPRWKLRTAVELETMLPEGESIENYLSSKGVHFITRHRRSDGALLVGLYTRN